MQRYCRDEKENYDWIVNVGKNHVAARETESCKKFRGKKLSEIPCKDKDPEGRERQKKSDEPEIRPVVAQTASFEYHY